MLYEQLLFNNASEQQFFRIFSIASNTKSCPVVSCKKNFLKIFGKFTEKQVFSCKFLEYFRTASLHDTREQLLLFFLWQNVLQNMGFL